MLFHLYPAFRMRIWSAEAFASALQGYGVTPFSTAGLSASAS